MFNIKNLINHKIFLKDSSTTTLYMLIGRSLGFLIPFLIGYWFATTSETDTFFYAYGLIMFVSGIVAPIIEITVVPYIMKYRNEGKDVGAFLGRLILFMSLFGIIIIIIAVCILPHFLSHITKFNKDEIWQVQCLFKEIAPLFILILINSYLAGALNAYNKFCTPALSPGVRAVVCIVFLVVFHKAFGIHCVIFGYIFGELIRVGVLIFAIKYYRLFTIRFRKGKAPSVLPFMKNVGQQTVGMIASNASPLIDQTMATWLGVLSVSFYFYADRLNMTLITFVTSGVLVTLVSYLSRVYVDSGINILHKRIKSSISYMFVVSLLLSVIFIVSSKFLIDIVFSKIDVPGRCLIGDMWRGYLYGFAPFVIARIYVRVLIVLEATKEIMYMGFLKLFVKICCNVVFIRMYGLVGLAYSTSIVSAFEFFCYTILYNRKQRSIRLSLQRGG